jgi:putative MATE family efflux protein
VSSQPRNPETARVRRRVRRQVLSLAIPALGALAAEPLFVMVDSAIVGHLGTAPLAGLALAGMVLETCVYLCVFLAYATTAGVARAYGAGQMSDAARRGIDALWLALGLGLAVGAVLLWGGRSVLGWFGPETAVLDAATEYLRYSAPGMPAMLVVLAATGVLRGLQNTKITLYVALAGGVIDAACSYLLCYPAGLGIKGSALGTVISQVVMALWAGGLVVVLARRHGASLLPHPHGVWAAARAGAPLFLRTCCLRAAGLTNLAVATSLGSVQLAAHQIVANVWMFSALATDALAIAAQALVGASLGRRDQETTGAEDGDAALTRAGGGGEDGAGTGVHGGCDGGKGTGRSRGSDLGAGTGAGELFEVKRAVIRMSVLAGVGLGVMFGALSWILPSAFTPDVGVRWTATVTMWALAACMPLAAWAFALDGILMGAGDGAFLAKGMAISLVCYLPAAAAAGHWGHGQLGLALAWIAYAGWFMLARSLVYRGRTARL